MYLKCYISSRVIKLDSVVKYLDFFSGKYTDLKLCKYTNIRSLKARKNNYKTTTQIAHYNNKVAHITSCGP